METGTVKWFNETKRFGFITSDSHSGDIFVHATNIESLDQKLEPGDRVQFERTEGPKGPEAKQVRVIEPEA